MQSFPKNTSLVQALQIFARDENRPSGYLEPAREKSWGLDLLQVDLTSFLASGAGFLDSEAAKRATKLRILNRTKDFSERLPGDERAALQARNRGRAGRRQWRGVGRGHEGYKHTSSPVLNQVLISKKDRYRVFSLTRPAYMQIYWNKRTRLHKKRVQLPEDWFGTPTWPPFHCFGTPIWPPWRHVKTLYWKARDLFVLKYRTGWRIWT